jgi:5-methylcytosine-specific restriction endonuclease McrA
MLDSPVLVLNRSWLPLQVANVRRTVTLLFKGHAEVVCPETFRTFGFEQWKSYSARAGGRFLHTPRYRIAVPEVMVLRNFNDVVRRRIRFNRRNIFQRDRNTCQYCGKVLPAKDLTLEHIRPVSKGGESSWENVVLACVPCNKRKRDLSLEQAGMRLLRAPGRPRNPVRVLPEIPRPRESWQPFLGRAAEPVAF